MQPLRVVFAGTPEFALPTLQALIDGPHKVVAAYTQPDRPAGRGKRLRASPVKQLAAQHDIPVYQPENFPKNIDKDPVDIEVLKGLQPDVMVVVAYGLILPGTVLGIPRYGCLNVHASLLPRWRGAAPIQRAILAGDGKSGVTIMQMECGLDTGDMLAKTTTPITADDTAQTLHDRLANTGAQALLDMVNQIAQGTPPAHEAQDNARATYAEKLSKQEAEINWAEDAITIDRRIRAYNPWPVAFTTFSGQPLRVWKACLKNGDHTGKPGEIMSLENNEIRVATGDGQLALQEVQPAGKQRMPVADFLNARRQQLGPGTLLGMSE